MCAVADVKAAHGNASQFKQPQPETIPSAPGIAFHQAVAFEDRGQAMHSTVVKFYLLRELGQAGIFASIGKRINNCQRTVQDLHFVRRRIRLTIRHRRAHYENAQMLSRLHEGKWPQEATKTTKMSVTLCFLWL